MYKYMDDKVFKCQNLEMWNYKIEAHDISVD